MSVKGIMPSFISPKRGSSGISVSNVTSPEYWMFVFDVFLVGNML